VVSPGIELGCDRRPAQHAYVWGQHTVEGGGIVQLLCYRHWVLADTPIGAQLQRHHLAATTSTLDASSAPPALAAMHVL
jgi:hypothetical protein